MAVPVNFSRPSWQAATLATERCEALFHPRSAKFRQQFPEGFAGKQAPASSPVSRKPGLTSQRNDGQGGAAKRRL